MLEFTKLDLVINWGSSHVPGNLTTTIFLINLLWGNLMIYYVTLYSKC